ncbi:hypothetical protein [Hymenobacter sp. BRD67]|uniref:hypothetical protein n=1 Tax=Hymenobacter sp. BRD67 TaxID=2675877 RepID=UPI001567B1FC|nr:hypothetical protein [Hymenobacter sp. BRD67]QKG52107.1 hypothetical protein GKZ67_05175 [Hymenobacter sp. BRD67]
MKTPALLLSLLLLVLLLPPAGHGAHQRPHYLTGGTLPLTPKLLPVRVLRTPYAAQQHKLVRAVRYAKRKESRSAFHTEHSPV